MLETEKKTYRAYIVSHTHWDREWFKPFQGFRTHLVDVIDELLEVLAQDPDYRYFLLDGQTAPIDDYLAIRPENRERLASRIQQGAIEIGPWFVEPDEFLVSGESLVRNLLRGFRMARTFGVEPMKEGYAADNFGHISQLPQIYAGFGIHSAIFFRGLVSSQTKHEFEWQGADGSQILGVLMESEWAYSSLWYALRDYCEGALPYDRNDVVQRLAALGDKHASRATSDILLFLDGVDHSPVWRDLSRAMHDANEDLSDLQLTKSRLSDYINDLRTALADIPLQRITGELRQTAKSRQSNIFQGTFTSRVKLKQANAYCEKLLANLCEPAAVFTHLLGQDYPTSYLNLAWQYLLLNHPHDSICGCSVDQVHKDMVYRFDQAQLIGEIQLQTQLEYLAKRVRWDADLPSSDDAPARIGFMLYNPDPRPSGNTIRITLTLDDDWASGKFRLLDAHGRELRYQVLGKKKDLTLIKEHQAVPIFRPDTRYTLLVELSEALPPMGYATLIAERHDGTGRITFPGLSTSAPHAMENEYLQVEIASNGAVSLVNKATGCRYENQLTFEDIGDVGDGWNFVPMPGYAGTYTTQGLPAKISRLSNGPLGTQFAIEYEMQVPTHALADHEHRADTLGINTIRSVVTLAQGVPYLDIETTIENRTCDHAIRAVFPTGLSGATVSAADTPFDVVERNITLPDTREWDEPAYSSWPRQSFVDISDGENGLAIISEGLYEYDIQDDLCRTLSCILVRGFANVVGKMHDNEGQHLGSHHFHYALYPHTGDWQAANLPAVAQSFRLAPIPVRNEIVGRGVALPAPERALPPAQSLFSISSDRLCLSTVKRTEDRDTVIVRYWNPTDTTISASLSTFTPFRQAFLVNLDEERQQEIPVTNGGVALSFAPRQIVTVELCY